MKVLFVCTGNSCRSQMAEGYMHHLGSNNIVAKSAGIEARGVNPIAIQVMQEDGVDISNQRSTVITNEMLNWADMVITLCAHADENCPVLPKGVTKLHWGIEDPAGATGRKEEVLGKFRKVRDEIKKNIENFIKKLEGNSTRN